MGRCGEKEKFVSPPHALWDTKEHALSTHSGTQVSVFAKAEKLVNISICSGDPCGKLGALVSFSQGVGPDRIFIFVVVVSFFSE